MKNFPAQAKKLDEYVRDGALPLFALRIPQGTHAQLLFHDHEYSEIAIVTKGRAKHLLNARAHELVAGDVLVLHPGLAHAYDQTATLELINIAYDHNRLALPLLDGQTLPLFRSFFPSEPEERDMLLPITNLNSEELAQVVALFERLQAELESWLPGNLLLSLALLVEVAIAIARFGGVQNTVNRIRFMVGDAVSHINRNYRENITIEKLARVAKMSERNFFRQFWDTVGCTPMEYLLSVRLSRAEEMLLHSNASITDIASHCGFCDSNYFSRRFRERREMTPREFRNKQRSSPLWR